MATEIPWSSNGVLKPKTVCRHPVCNFTVNNGLIAYRNILDPHAVIRVFSAYHSEERKVQAPYILVVGINPPKPPETVLRRLR